MYKYVIRKLFNTLIHTNPTKTLFLQKNNTMKLRFTILSLIVLILFSCKKEDVNNANNCEAPSYDVTSNSNYVYISSFSGSSDYYEVEYGITGFTKGNGTKLTFPDNNIQVNDLANGTYDFYLRGNCGGSSFSNWIGPKSFVIDGSSSSCANPNNLTVFTPFAGYDFDWSGSSDYYDIEVGETGFTIGTGTRERTNFTTSSLSTAVFETGKTYDFYVKGYCGSTAFSTWVGPKSFYADEDQNVCGAPNLYFADKESDTKISYSFIGSTGSYEVSLSTSSTTPTSTIYPISYSSGYFTGTGFTSGPRYIFVRSLCPNGTKSRWSILVAS